MGFLMGACQAGRCFQSTTGGAVPWTALAWGVRGLCALVWSLRSVRVGLVFVAVPPVATDRDLPRPRGPPKVASPSPQVQMCDAIGVWSTEELWRIVKKRRNQRGGGLKKWCFNTILSLTTSSKLSSLQPTTDPVESVSILSLACSPAHCSKKMVLAMTDW
ncbi:hypothetical protein D4764_0220070 [Takifugu flavidus]|uniref:Uncharacterized protein n=1 Tax=Takifugu flavidus TaxID=433684 RepID=A0A5C6MI74_9TELE|nr:hypothetical protein D4764_0220070 [Takifugu flavidus]